MPNRTSTALCIFAVLVASWNSVAAPIRIVVLQDKTGSANWTRTPQLTLNDFEPLIDFLKTTSGELAFGLIRDFSNRGLVRLRIDSPPDVPAKFNQSGHVFDDMRAAKSYRAARGDYQEKLELWKAAATANVATFEKQIQPLLDLPADARATDVFGALRRADLLLSEPQARDAAPVHAWILVASDGAHNRGPSTGCLTSGARLILINSAGASGDLKRCDPLRFESISSAVRFLIQTEKTGADHATNHR